MLHPLVWHRGAMAGREALASCGSWYCQNASPCDLTIWDRQHLLNIATFSSGRGNTKTPENKKVFWNNVKCCYLFYFSVFKMMFFMFIPKKYSTYWSFMLVLLFFWSYLNMVNNPPTADALIPAFFWEYFSIIDNFEQLIKRRLCKRFGNGRWSSSSKLFWDDEQLVDLSPNAFKNSMKQIQCICTYTTMCEKAYGYQVQLKQLN